MALLDFMKNRPQQMAANATPKTAPETPKPEAQKDVSKVLSPGELAKFREVGERLQKATAHARGGMQQSTAGDSGNAALIQKQNNQEKAQAALSPTDRFKGQTAVQKRSRGMER
jgi:hypothetical protein